jgi:hypothetical protein
VDTLDRVPTRDRWLLERLGKVESGWFIITPNSDVSDLAAICQEGDTQGMLVAEVAQTTPSRHLALLLICFRNFPIDPITLIHCILYIMLQYDANHVDRATL